MECVSTIFLVFNKVVQEVELCLSHSALLAPLGLEDKRVDTGRRQKDSAELSTS